VEEQILSQVTLKLELAVKDSSTVKYLTGFEESTRNDRALEALRIGVIAIQSAIVQPDIS
jgi:hypothetical protein